MKRARIARLLLLFPLTLGGENLSAGPSRDTTAGKSPSNVKHSPTNAQASGAAKTTPSKKETKPALGASNPSKTKKGKSTPRGLVQMYAQAMQLFDAGKFAEALVAFDAIHRKYPAHEPTVVQYAKTLYRLDRIPESYNLFARVNPQYLDAETAYEYGYAFYIQSQFEGALYSFKRVPVDHALYDLASYYAAMSAIRLKRYGEAEELLDKAVVLPDKLARNKSLYQKHVASLRLLQERAELERTSADEKKRLATEAAQGKTPPAGGAQPEANPGPPAPYSHAGFFGVARLGKISHTKTEEIATFHSESEKRYTSEISAFSFSHGPVIPLNIKVDSRQAAVGSQIDLKATNIASKGSKVLLRYNETEEIVQTLVQKSPLETTRSGDIGGNIWFELPLPSNWWFGLDGHLSFTYPNFERGQRYGSRGIYTQFGWMKDGPTSWIGTLGATYDLIVDSETVPFLSSSSLDGSLMMKIPSGSTITVGGRLSMLENLLSNSGVPGPETSGSGFVSLRQEFPLNISLSATGTAEKKQMYTAKDPEQGGAIVSTADADTLSGSIKAGAAPFAWLSFSAVYKFNKNYWTIHKKDRTERFQALTPSEESLTDLTASINFTF